MMRIGDEGIVTFPNFGYWKNPANIASRKNASWERITLAMVRHPQYSPMHH